MIEFLRNEGYCDEEITLLMNKYSRLPMASSSSSSSPPVGSHPSTSAGRLEIPTQVDRSWPIPEMMKSWIPVDFVPIYKDSPPISLSQTPSLPSSASSLAREDTKLSSIPKTMQRLNCGQNIKLIFNILIQGSIATSTTAGDSGTRSKWDRFRAPLQLTLPLKKLFACGESREIFRDSHNLAQPCEGNPRITLS